MSRADNIDLNSEIDSFLYRLMPYFLLNPAHRALEWLIYRYQVHQFNIDTILTIALPYHDTNTFARLLSILQIAETDQQWSWLIPFQRLETPVPRRALLNRALSSGHILLTFVCEQIAVAFKVNIYISFLYISSMFIDCRRTICCQEFATNIHICCIADDRLSHRFIASQRNTRRQNCTTFGGRITVFLSLFHNDIVFRSFF